MVQRNSLGGYVLLALLAVATLIAFVFLAGPKKDDSTRLERAADEVSDGVEKAGRELEPNRTPADKIGDAVEDAGESISKSDGE